MKLRTEISIDLDQNRKIWLTTIAEDVTVDEVEDVVEGMAGNLVQTAVKAHQAVMPGIDPQYKPRIPPTFQED